MAFSATTLDGRGLRHRLRHFGRAGARPARRARVLSDALRQPRQDPYLWLDGLRRLTAAPIIILSGWAHAYADHQDQGFVALRPRRFDLGDLVAVVKRRAGTAHRDG